MVGDQRSKVRSKIKFQLEIWEIPAPGEKVSFTYILNNWVDSSIDRCVRIQVYNNFVKVHIQGQQCNFVHDCVFMQKITPPKPEI